MDPDATDLEGDGRRLLAPMLAVATPIVAILDAVTIGSICEEMAPGTELTPRMIELRHLGGAYTQSPLAPSSATGRHARFNLYTTATSDPVDAAATRRRVDDVSYPELEQIRRL